MNDRTDWDLYYRTSPITTRWSRPIIFGALLKALQCHSVPNPVLAELGGAGSRVFDKVAKAMEPATYYVVDTNQFGLDLLRGRVPRANVHFVNQDVRQIDLPVEVDTVFSLGLIEHFDLAGTRAAVRAHLKALKPGGIAIISFPTPTFLYRATRHLAEAMGKWIFHDERPLWAEEVADAIAGEARVLSHRILWPMILTQSLMVVRKNG